MNEDYGWAAKIIGALIAVAGGLNYWRLKSSSTSRQLKDDTNANNFYADMAKRVTELDTQNQAMWKQIVETQQKAAESKHEASLWMYKFGILEENNKLLQDKNALTDSALETARAEIDRLKAKENP